MDLPYRAEYAKSGRASCRGCKSTIVKDDLRLAVMVQSPMYDGKTPHWYHAKCFFKKQRAKTVDDIEHFESLRWEDQEMIKGSIESASSIVVPAKKGKKRSADTASSSKGALKDFIIEYARSSRSTCQGCEQKIMKEEVRISKKDFESDVGKKYGGQDRWHHVTCFAKLRSELGYFESGTVLPGFKALKAEDQKEVKTHIPAIKQEDMPEEKKIKVEDVVDGVVIDEKKMKEQNKLMYKYRDQLKTQLKKKHMQQLLEANFQQIPSGEETLLDRLCDIMTFGTLAPCENCNGGQFIYQTGGYVCDGNLTEWTKCNKIVREPKRTKFKVPKDLASEFSFLKKYKYEPRTRVIKEVKPRILEVKKDDPDGGKPKVEREKLALSEMEFVILSKPARGKDALKKQIMKLGGKVTTKISNSVMAVFASPNQVETMGAKVSEAQKWEVHVISEDFIDEAPTNSGRIPDLVIKKSICDWGSDPNTRLPSEPSASQKSKSRSIYTSAMPSKIKLKLKGGVAVDPDSGIADDVHVYQDKNDKYTVTLGLTDIQRQKNSFYKIQLLEADVGNKYWVFRSWGRIGTTIGGNKLESFGTLHEAKKLFSDMYEEKSGNMWEDRHNFTKVPGRMYPIDVEYGESDAGLEVANDVPSKLPTPLQNLVKMIFDINAMKKVMLEFELDTEKMPLGKLSQSQIQSAFSVLGELQKLIKDKGDMSRFIDASNRFYTFIPHTFGVDNPPVIDSEDVVKQKVDMLQNLMELEIAYGLLKSSGANTGVDTHYEQLKAEISVVDEKADEFEIVKEYIRNTHAETHSHYDLELEQLFEVKRQGEEKRHKPFKKLHNRKLLWHGSRLTNFAGILAQGLRIAPPEAPVTGYMFGKGIYFADMVSKSANYCCTSPSVPTGLMLLCEVALGDMFECKNATYVEKLPKGTHSCKGMGMSHPDPSQVKEINGVQVPLGKSVPVDNLQSSLLYNEYIVYDVAQVQVKYLCQMNFKYKY